MRSLLLVLLACMGVLTVRAADQASAPLRVGKAITESAALRYGVSILPDGSGLPPGRGTAKQGAVVYAAHCAACHGEKGEGREGFPALVGGRGSLSTDKPLLTVGSYWPTATTLFDYIWRGMPYATPGTLSADETYALSAWILSANGIIEATQAMDAKSLPRVRMPNADGFTAGHAH